MTDREQRATEVLDAAGEAWAKRDYAKCRQLLLHEWAAIWADSSQDHVAIPPALLKRFYVGWDLLDLVDGKEQPPKADNNDDGDAMVLA